MSKENTVKIYSGMWFCLSLDAKFGIEEGTFKLSPEQVERYRRIQKEWDEMQNELNRLRDE